MTSSLVGRGLSPPLVRFVDFERPRWITPGIGGAFSTSTPSASMAGRRSCGSEMTGANRSPTLSSRSQIVRMEKSPGLMPPASTSSHVTGVDTVAPGSGRIEYTAAMFAPLRFMLWSMNTFPVRVRTSHCMVTRSGSALRIITPMSRTNSRTSSWVKRGSIGT